MLYLGDLDKSGRDIEANTRRVLGATDLRRLAMTEQQAEGIEPIWKVDGRDGNGHRAWEVESLRQRALAALVREALRDLLPEPLADVQERERQQRRAAEAMFDGLLDG